MNEYEQIISVISLTMGVAWASGINLYAALLILGLGGATGNIELPESLQVLQDPMVIGAAGLMYFVEFVADKTPGVDTGWDAIHTFIRIPAGAMLAAASVGDVTPALQVSAGLLGGTLTGATHAAKAGSRVLINTSPEPFSNWTASIAEDLAVLGGLWMALNHPIIFAVLLVVFLGLVIWLLPKLWRGVKAVFRKLRSWFGAADEEPVVTPLEATPEGDAAERLQRLRDEGKLSDEEFRTLMGG